MCAPYVLLLSTHDTVYEDRMRACRTAYLCHRMASVSCAQLPAIPLPPARHLVLVHVPEMVRVSRLGATYATYNIRFNSKHPAREDPLSELSPSEAACFLPFFLTRNGRFVLVRATETTSLAVVRSPKPYHNWKRLQVFFDCKRV